MLQLITNKVIGECIIVGPKTVVGNLIIGFITIQFIEIYYSPQYLSHSFSQSMIMPVEDKHIHISSNNH